MGNYFYSTQYWKIGLCEDQRYLGYLIIKTVESRQALPDLTENEQKDFFLLIKKLEFFYKEEFNATMFNYSCLMNNAYRDNEPPHVHFHFRPRYKNPITVLGQEFKDPNFGEHYINSSSNGNGKIFLSEEIRNHVIAKLKNYLEQ